MKYITPDHQQQRMVERYDSWIQDMYADLVAAIHIARAFEAKCERLEAMLENAGDLARDLQEQSDSWAEAFFRLQHQRDQLVAENNRLRAELDRLELVS